MFARLTSQDDALIAELNQLDLEYYAFARDLMWERIAETGVDWEQRLADFKGELALAMEQPLTALNTKLYLKLNPDVRAAGVDPMMHFLFHGQFEERDGCPPLARQKDKPTRQCLAPWQDTSAPCPERPGTLAPEQRMNAQRVLRYRLMLGELDDTCRQCRRAGMMTVPQYLREIQARRLPVDMNSVGMASALSQEDTERGTRILVIGRAKTGTTVISKTIQYSLPNATYSMEPRTIGHFESIAAEGGNRVVKLLFGDWKKRRHLLEGVLGGETGFTPDFIVATVRDPRDNAISAMFYKARRLILNGATRVSVEQWIDLIQQKERAPSSISLAQMISEMGRIFGFDQDLPNLVMEDISDYASLLSDHRDRLFVLRYEDFIAGELEALESYLGFPLSEKREVPENLQRVRRSSSAGSWRQLMLPSDIALLREACGQLLAQYGYNDWTLADEPSLDPSHGSEYVRRISEEAFLQRESQSTSTSSTPSPPAQPITPKIGLQSQYRFY